MRLTQPYLPCSMQLVVVTSARSMACTSKQLPALSDLTSWILLRVSVMSTSSHKLVHSSFTSRTEVSGCDCISPFAAHQQMPTLAPVDVANLE